MTAPLFASTTHVASVCSTMSSAARRHSTRCLAGLGPEPLEAEFNGPYLLAKLAGKINPDQIGAARSADRCRTRQYLCLRGAVPRRCVAATPRRIHQPGTRRPARRGNSIGSDPRPSRPADLRSATTFRRMGSWAISSTAGRSMATKAIPVRVAIAAGGCAASFRRDDRPTSVRSRSALALWLIQKVQEWAESSGGRKSPVFSRRTGNFIDFPPATTVFSRKG